jgi:3'(2'), 5'-bisphosphate nucleotidase
MGVILCPELGQTYGGAEGLGAFRLEPDGARTPIHVTDTRGREAADVLVSRFHAPASIEAFRTLFGVAQVRPVGSSGVKAAFLASGQADAYVQAGPAGSLWDGCAADALVHAAGGKFTNARGERLDYRTPVLRMETGVLATNAWLHDALLERLVAQRAIPEG